MSFSYETTESHISSVNYWSAVRFVLQDTIEDEAEFTDEEIDAQYNATDETASQTVRNLTVAVALARVLHRRYAKQASFSSQGTSVQLLERAKYWSTMIEDLQADLQIAQIEDGGTGGILYAGRSTSFIDQTGINLGGYIV